MAITKTPGYMVNRGMGGLGIRKGYVGQALAAARPIKTKAPVLGASPATKASLLPYLEGALGLPGVPRTGPPPFVPTLPTGNAGEEAEQTGYKSVPKSAVPSNYVPTLDEILNHPLYQSALGTYNTNLQAWQDMARNAIATSAVAGGYDPTEQIQNLLATSTSPALKGFQLSSLLNPATIAAVNEANRAGTSKYAQSIRGRDLGMKRLVYELAARGIGTSGAAATGTNAITQATQQEMNTQRANLLSDITQAVGDYQTRASAGLTGLDDIRLQVASLLAQAAGPTYPEGESDVYDVENTDQVSVPDTGGTVPSAATKPPPGSGIPWFGGTTFYTKAQMAAELKRRGQSYAAWAQRYPAAASMLI